MSDLTVARLVTNATRVGKESQHVVLAAALLPHLADRRLSSLCVWCAEAAPDAVVYRLPRGGECHSCPYVGYDCLVVDDTDRGAP